MIPDIIRKAARSAVTGRFVAMWRAFRWPGTTVVETIRYPAPRKRASATRRRVKKQK
jgi:hypothetical protein